MNLFWLEALMYELSGWFMVPVLMLLALLFLYSLFALGQFAAQWWLRRRARFSYSSARRGGPVNVADLSGFSLMALSLKKPDISTEELDVIALKELEALKIITRVAPMLGLIATMIPMAPALKSLSNGNIQGISENLVVAFSAVIFGMVIASITFWLLSVKRRWLAVELVDIGHIKSRQQQSEALVLGEAPYEIA